MKHKDITVVLLLYKTPKKLLKNFKSYKSFNILILDQSNDLKTKKSLEEILPNIKYYGITKTNKGYAKAQNYLIKKVKTKYFFSTQSDISLSANSILKLQKTIIKFNKSCIISVPKISGLKNTKIIKKKNNKKEYAIKNMIGAAFMADKKKFTKLGMFDENFFFYWEDVDLSHRIMQSKYNIYLNSDSIANHISGASTENNFRTFAIRNINFKFGEYFFASKIGKLRLIKIIRQLILNLIYSVIYFILFKFKKAYKCICYFFGIIKFFYYKINLFERFIARQKKI